MKIQNTRTAIFLSLLTPFLAQAHDASAHSHISFFSGLIHPLTGLDHLAMLLAVGFWVANQKSNARFVAPALFVLSALFGSTLAHFGVNLPWIETGILASLGLMGTLMLFSGRVHVSLAQGAIVVFAGLHGFAHGLSTIDQSASDALAYGGGFTISMFALIVLSCSLTSCIRTSHQVTLNRGFGALLGLFSVFALAISA